jgi:tellurite resistance protein
MPNRHPSGRLGISTTEITAADVNQSEAALLDATVTAAALVARADGVVQPIERVEMLGVLRRNGLLSAITRFDMLDAFESRLHRLEADGGVEAAVERLGRFAGRSPAWIVVETAERVAAADRHVDGRELQILRRIHVALSGRMEGATMPLVESRI